MYLYAEITCENCSSFCFMLKAYRKEEFFMIITHHYQLDYDDERKLYIVKNKQAPMCPD